jgi:hypothetical protein
LKVYEGRNIRLKEYKVSFQYDPKVFADVFGDKFESFFSPPESDSVKIDDVQIKRLYEDNYSTAFDGFTNIDTAYYMDKGEGIDTPFEFDYVDDDCKSYKFLSMDINEDFDVIIPFKTGYVRLFPLFTESYLDVLKGKKIKERDLYEVCKKLTKTDVRKIVTLLKNGWLYKVCKDFGGSVSDSWLQEIQRHVGEITDVIGADNVSTISPSVIYNILINKGEEVQDTDEYSDGIFVITGLVILFTDVVTKYKHYATLFSSIDMMRFFATKVLGDKEFNNRIKGCLKVTDSTTGEVQEDMVVSFSGASKDLDVLGKNRSSNIFTEWAEDFVTLVEGKDLKYTVPSSILMTNVDDRDYGDKSYLDRGDLQLLSSLDSLRFADSEGDYTKDSYNIEDKDEMNLYVQSVMDGMSRKLEDYQDDEIRRDLFSQLSQMEELEKIEAAEKVIASKENLDKIYDLGSKEITTLSSTEILIDKERDTLKKALMLVKKISKRVLNKVEE